MIFGLMSFALGLGAESGDSGPRVQSPLDAFSPEERAGLLQGNAIYKSALSSEPDVPTKGCGTAAVLINAGVEQCFQMFCDFEKQRLYFPRMTESKVLSAEGSTVKIYKELDYGVFIARYTHLLAIDLADHRVDFKTDPEGKNDVKYSAGFFRFQKVDEHQTLFSYGLVKFDAGFRVPAFIQNYMTSRDLPAMAADLKKWIESNGQWKK